MRILFINSVLGFGSTGRIVLDLAKEFRKNGDEAKIAYGRLDNDSEVAEEYGVRIGGKADVLFHALYTRLTDKHGLASKRATRTFLKWAEAYNPDMLWLHNIHDYYINYEMLFKWIKSRPQMQVKWTLHDCWAFTGHCSHFTYVKCDKWTDGCNACPQLNQYPKSFTDNSKDNYLRKKAAFTGVKNMTLIVPSAWLKGLVERSFLSEYKVDVVFNTVDEKVFKPTESNIKETLGIKDKKMILGVASVWNDRKGLNDFIKLSEKIDKDKYRIVLVGLNDDQIKNLNSTNPGIIALPRTENVSDLVKYYSASDVFVNPSYEETFGLTTIEAIFCGTKAIAYSGSAAEEIALKYGGTVVSQDVDELYAEIRRVTE